MFEWLLRWLSPKPEPRMCLRGYDHPADRETVVGGVIYGWCWLHVDHMRLLIRLSPPEPEPDPCRAGDHRGQRFPGARPGAGC